MPQQPRVRSGQERTAPDQGRTTEPRRDRTGSDAIRPEQPRTDLSSPDQISPGKPRVGQTWTHGQARTAVSWMPSQTQARPQQPRAGQGLAGSGQNNRAKTGPDRTSQNPGPDQTRSDQYRPEPGQNSQDLTSADQVRKEAERTGPTAAALQRKPDQPRPGPCPATPLNPTALCGALKHDPASQQLRRQINPTTPQCIRPTGLRTSSPAAQATDC